MPPASTLGARKPRYPKIPVRPVLTTDPPRDGSRPSRSSGSSSLPAVSPSPPITLGSQAPPTSPIMTFGLSSLPSAISSKRRRTTTPLSSTTSSLDGSLAAGASAKPHDEDLMKLITPGPRMEVSPNSTVTGVGDEVESIIKDTGSSTDAITSTGTQITRKGAPPIYNRTRGSKTLALEIARDPLQRAEAIRRYRKDIKSAGDTSKFNKVTWTMLHAAWWAFVGVSWPAFPLTPAKVEGVGVLLKAAGYRSADNYMTAAKEEHIGGGHPWTDALTQAAHHFHLSTNRGLGPSKQSEPLDFEACIKLGVGEDPPFDGGPVGLANLIVLFTYFLLRDIEGSLARWADIYLNRKKKTVTWRLSVSKTDPAAKGCERTWGCLCSPHSVACPFHAALAQDELLAKRFPKHSRDELPLFPTAAGDTVTTGNMVKTVEHLAVLTGEPLKTKTGVNRFGRHSWRSMGAVWLTRARVEIFRIQLLARWSHRVITHYARMAPLTGLTEHVRELQTVNSLSKVIEDLKESLDMLKSKHTNLEEHVIKEIRDEIKTKADLEDSVTKPNDYVKNTETGIFHKTRASTIGDVPILWKARCGWKFGSTFFEKQTAYPDDAKALCDKCFYRERLDLKNRAAQLLLRELTAS